MKAIRNSFRWWLIAGVVGLADCSVKTWVLGQSSADGVFVPATVGDYPSTRFWLAAATNTSRNAWETSISQPMQAVILEIDERDLVCVFDGKPTPTRLPSAQLQAIDVVWAAESAASAHAAFLKADFTTAIELSKKAILDGTIPRWQQKILAAEITDSLMGLGQTASAGRVFLSLCKESPAPLLYASAPLLWNSQRGNAQLVQQAQEWIQSERTPIEQLMGASWLLSDDPSTAAQSSLEKLSRSQSPIISQLATAQLWRKALPNRVLGQYQEWSDYRDRMLLPLQVGPTVTIADKLERAGHQEEALQEWLRIVTLYPKDRREVRQARAAAMELLKQLGRLDEAKRLEALPSS